MPKNNSKKYKNSQKNQVIYGLHAVKAALANQKREHVELIITENHKKLGVRYRSKVKKITILEQKQYKKLFGDEKATQGLVLKTYDYPRLSLEEFVKYEHSSGKSILLALDQITDPQNIGSIMRSCALFKCKAVITSKDNAPDLTPSLLKAASGAVELVNYYKVTNLRRTINNFKKNGYWIYGFDSSSKKTSNLNFEKKSVLVFGSEGSGIRDLIKKECDFFIKLKMEANSKFKIDSLNVSNATSIALYEFYKNN